jgi:hypothetical protein
VDAKQEAVDKCIRILHDAGIDTQPVRMFGDSHTQAIIPLPGFVPDELKNNTLLLEHEQN